MAFPSALPLARLAILATLSLAGAGSAQDIAAEQRIDFDIPAQPLDTALTLYFRRTGVQLLYDSTITADRRSSPIKGRYARREALALLLRGTGLIARYSGADAAVITMPSRSGETPAVPLGRVVVREKVLASRANAVDRLAFYGQLEAALESFLHEDPRTRRLSFRLSVILHLSETGRVAEVRVSRGSGDGKKDQLVAAALRGRMVPAPPEGIAQPLLVAVRSQSGEPRKRTSP